jgi:hypothetical protein
MSRRQIRAARLAAVQRKHSDPLEDDLLDQEDDEGDIDDEDAMPLRGGGVLNPRAAWPFPAQGAR